jgi:alpha-soluble NSF attachment protein
MRIFLKPNIEKELMDSTANQCYQQAAELSGDLGEYHRAMELYQTVADWSLTSALTKYSVKEYWLRAALCSMAMGVSLLSPCIVQC